jgi:hypothetical protein
LRPEAAEDPGQATEPADPSITAAAPDNQPTADHPDATLSNTQPTESSDEVFSEKDCIRALEELRETVIAKGIPNWDRNRSVLRDAMIETFVRQKLVDPEEWFNLIPQFMRMATNPLEKSLYLARICEIVARLDRPSSQPKPGVAGEQTDGSEVAAGSSEVAGSDPERVTRAEPLNQSTTGYQAVDPSKCGETLSADRFYDGSYRRTLGVLVERIVSTEAPVYFDVLVNRIARAHGFQRSGNNIQSTIMSVVDRRFPRSDEDGRLVLWSPDATPPAVVAYRASPDRPYTDVPLLELAGLARAYLKLRMSDDEVLRRMGDDFQLGRVREAARVRFEAAIALAK